MVAGRDAATFGEAKNSWLTGTAAWTFVDVSQFILGIQPTLAGLKIDPCIPHTMDGFTLRRVWRGATYEIVVENPDHLEKGVKAMTVDGKPVSGNILSPVPVCSSVVRTEANLSQAQLAEMVGVSRNTISSIETGQFNPTAKLALILCIALDKKFEELFYF